TRSQRELQRDDARVLARPGCDLLAVGVAAVGAHELRQGRARPGHARLARRRAGALSRRPGGRRLSSALELAERALGAAPPGDALVQVTGERSLTMRFAASSPTQSTAVDDVTVLVSVCREGRVGSATTNLTDADSLREVGRAASAAAEA